MHCRKTRLHEIRSWELTESLENVVVGLGMQSGTWGWQDGPWSRCCGRVSSKSGFQLCPRHRPPSSLFYKPSCMLILTCRGLPKAEEWSRGPGPSGRSPVAPVPPLEGRPWRLHGVPLPWPLTLGWRIEALNASAVEALCGMAFRASVRSRSCKVLLFLELRAAGLGGFFPSAASIPQPCSTCISYQSMLNVSSRNCGTLALTSRSLRLAITEKPRAWFG